MLVPKRIAGLAAALSDSLDQLDHLVDSLFAVEPHDVVVTKLAPAFLGFARQCRKHLDEHRDHRLGPALPDQRERPVKIQKHVADARSRDKSWREFDQASELS